MEIDKINGRVAFNDSAHVYWDIENPNKKYTSVTTLIHKYSQPFDEQFWSKYKALEKLLPKESWMIEKRSLLGNKKFNKELLSIYHIDENDFNREQQNILDAWDEKKRIACERGTKIHAEIENSFYDKPKNISMEKFGIGGKFECKKNYYELDMENGIYPEYLIYWESDDEQLCIAGQVDLIIKSGNDIVIADWKTNEKIEQSGYNKMQFPLNLLPDCNFSHYTLQLSMYAWMLQQINPNLNIKDLIINHYNHKGGETIYHCEYLKNDVEKLLKYYKKEIILENKRNKRKRIEY